MPTENICNLIKKKTMKLNNHSIDYLILFLPKVVFKVFEITFDTKQGGYHFKTKIKPYEHIVVVRTSKHCFRVIQYLDCIKYLYKSFDSTNKIINYLVEEAIKKGGI